MEQLEHNQIVEFRGIHCDLEIEQLAPHVIRITISGSDIGEFGEAPMRAIQERLSNSDSAGLFGSAELFIDARAVRRASTDVSCEWAKWLGKRRASFHTITMLTGSRFVNITAEFVRRFAGLEGVMRVCTEPEVFRSAIADSLNSR